MAKKIKKIKIGLVGCGYWGKKLLGYLNDHEEFHVKHICDSKTDMNKVWDNVEATVIATPTETHYKIAKKALEKGKHVFVEKPIAFKKAEAINLKKLAENQDLALLTDFTWTFSKALWLAQKTDIGEIKIVEIDIKRPLRDDVVYDAFWVLGSHALAILDMFVPLQRLRFEKVDFFADSGMILFRCGDKHPRLVGRISVSIDHPEKETKVTIYGDEGTIIYNPSEHSLRIREEIHLFDEKNNLKHAVDYFYKAINEGAADNIDRAILVTEILEKS